MNEFLLIIGGLIVAFFLLRSMLRSRDPSTATAPAVDRDWGAFVNNLSRRPDPDHIQFQICSLSDQELLDLHQWFGLSPPGDQLIVLDAGTRTRFALDIFRRILGL